MPRCPRWLLLALPIAAFLALAGTPVGLAQEEYDRWAEETAEIRELPLAAEIVESFLTRDELRERLPELVAEELSPAEAEAISRAWAAFGLLPPGSDFAQLYLGLLDEQVAGYYDPEEDEMVVVGDDDLDATDEFTYVHETVHALQDQHLGLAEILAAHADRSSDQVLAVTSLYEGDAMAATYDYVASHPGLAARLAMAALGGTEQVESVPPILSLGLLFPYLDGLGFVAELRATGGWEAVDAAYADLPQSTEQILHPEKYLERDAPTPVALPDLGAALGDGWQAVEEDDLGELQIAILLADLEPGEGLDLTAARVDLPEPATDAAAGWDGDRYALWASGERELLVWRSIWDSEQDATAFSRALQAYDETRLGSFYEGEIPEEVALVADDRAAMIVQDGAEVSYVLAPTYDLASAAMGLLREA